MTNMTKKEIIEFGKDLMDAKIRVMNKHGFTNEEISRTTNVPESIVRKILGQN